MKIPLQINSIKELQDLQDLACKSHEDVYIHSADDSVKVDAKSFIGLFALDFSEEVYVVTESEWLAKKLRTSSSDKRPA